MEIYVVQPGDTVQSIADRFNLPYNKIVRDNNIRPEYGIVNGQIIILAYPTITYEVMPGDTWASIAAANGITVKQLLQNNPFLADRDYLVIGEELVISYDKNDRKIDVNAYCYPFIDLRVLRKSLPYLTYLTITGYQINVFGQIEEPEDTIIIRTAREFGVAAIMMISTFAERGRGSFGITHKLFNDPIMQTELINNIVNLLEAKGMQGVSFGFDFIIPEDLDNYISFIAKTKELLVARGFLVHVAVNQELFPIYVNGDISPYYSQLGQIADLVILVSYTWAAAYIPDFEQTTVPFLESYVEFAVTQIPPNKISLGYTRIAYDWELPYVEGRSVVNAIANPAALALASEVGQDLDFDEFYKTPFFRYFDAGIERFVWFKDARSLDALLDIIIEYNLNGISIWNIMDFTPQLWVTIISQYNVGNI